MELKYEIKYKKYKNKYLQLKNMIGGGITGVGVMLLITLSGKDYVIVVRDKKSGKFNLPGGFIKEGNIYNTAYEELREETKGLFKIQPSVFSKLNDNHKTQHKEFLSFGLYINEYIDASSKIDLRLFYLNDGQIEHNYKQFAHELNVNEKKIYPYYGETTHIGLLKLEDFISAGGLTTVNDLSVDIKIYDRNNNFNILRQTLRNRDVAIIRNFINEKKIDKIKTNQITLNYHEDDGYTKIKFLKWLNIYWLN